MAESFPHAEMQAVAAELIEFFGRKVTLRRRGTSDATAGKPWEGKAAPSSSTSFSNVDAAFVSFTAKDRGASPSIKMTDKRVLLGVQSEEITTDWEIVDVDGSLWKIESVLDQVQPGPLIILYDLQVRV